MSIDEGAPDEVREFGQRPRPELRPAAGPHRAHVQQLYQTTGVPESFLLDRRGVIVKRVIGGARLELATPTAR